MIELLVMIIATQIATGLFGAGTAFAAGRVGWPTRLGIAWLSGAALLTVIAPLLSLLGSWGERSIAIPLLIISAVIGWRSRSRSSSRDEQPAPVTVPSTTVILAASTALLIAAIASGYALSTSAYSEELAKSERWASEGIEPRLFMTASPASPPLPSMVPMWSSMIEPELAREGGGWIVLILSMALIAVMYGSAGKLGRSATIGVGAVAVSASVATVGGSLAGASEGWLVWLVPAFALVVSARVAHGGIDITLAALVALSDPHGIFVVAAVAGALLLRGERRAAVRCGVAALVSLLPWWVLLAVEGVLRVEMPAAVSVAPWRPSDATLILIAGTSLVLIIARGRRLRNGAAPLAAAAAILALLPLWTAGHVEYWLQALRLATPTLAAAACLLALRPLPVNERLRSRPA